MASTSGDVASLPHGLRPCLTPPVPAGHAPPPGLGTDDPHPKAQAQDVIKGNRPISPHQLRRPWSRRVANWKPSRVQVLSKPLAQPPGFRHGVKPALAG